MVILRATKSFFLNLPNCLPFAPCRGIQNYGHKKQEPNFLFALLLVVHSTLAGVKST